MDLIMAWLNPCGDVLQFATVLSTVARDCMEDILHNLEAELVEGLRNELATNKETKRLLDDRKTKLVSVTDVGTIHHVMYFCL